jgi:hypothetical protein
LFYLSREAFKRRLIDDLWQVKAATSANSLGAVIMSDTIVDQIRKELRRQSGHNIEPGTTVPVCYMASSFLPSAGYGGWAAALRRAW